MNISQVVFYESITEVEPELLSDEAKKVIQDNYDAMDELSDYIEETIGTMDSDGVTTVDIGDLDEYLTYGIKEDKKAQEILNKHMKKYKVTNITQKIEGKIHHRIKALKDFSNVHKGDYGGWILDESNLSQEGDCWIEYDALATDTSYVGDNARLMGFAVVLGTATIRGNATVLEYAEIDGNAKVYGRVSGYALIGGEIIVEEGAEVSGKLVLEGKGTLTSGMTIK